MTTCVKAFSSHKKYTKYKAQRFYSMVPSYLLTMSRDCVLMTLSGKQARKKLSQYDFNKISETFSNEHVLEVNVLAPTPPQYTTKAGATPRFQSGGVHFCDGSLQKNTRPLTFS